MSVNPVNDHDFTSLRCVPVDIDLTEARTGFCALYPPVYTFVRDSYTDEISLYQKLAGNVSCQAANQSTCPAGLPGPPTVGLGSSILSTRKCLAITRITFLSF